MKTTTRLGSIDSSGTSLNIYIYIYILWHTIIGK